jgi:exonuclease SbcD
MRILHTSDWHMNDRLGFQDRSADICRALEQIANYLEAYKVDVMLVTGDLFERGNADKKEIAIAEFKRIFQPFLTRNGTILAISGNHDDETFFGTLRDALDLVAPGRKGRDGTHATGRLYIAPKPRNLQLADEAGNVVQFVLMPYPTTRCYLQRPDYHTIEERNQIVQHHFRNTLDELKSRLDKRYPSVLLSHVNIRGVKAHPLYRLSESDDVIFEPEHVPTYFAYAAYGHIHKPQEAIPGASHMRYAGSIERMDANESDDQKSVVFLEIADNRRVGEPEILPLNSTPIYHVEITDPDAQIPRLAELHQDADHALVKYTLYWQPGRHNKDELCRTLNSIFKRCYARDFVEVGRGDAGTTGFTTQPIENVVGNVNEYLKIHLAAHPQGTEIKALADELLAEGGWR